MNISNSTRNLTDNGNKARTHRGFSLIELMVSVVLGLILIGGVMQVFIANKQTYNVNEGVSRIQENGRFALDILTADIRMIGYQGCASLDIPIVNVVDLDKNGTADSEFDELSISLEGYNYVSGTTWSPVLPAWGGVTPTPGTDVILVSRMDDEGIHIRESMPSTSAELKVTDVGLINEGDAIFISDCQKGAVFGVTQVQDSAKHLQKNLTLNVSKTLTADGSPFGKDASIYRVLNIVYFIAASTVDNNRGATPQALWRQINGGNPEELVAGVNDLQLLFGEDTNDDLVPDRYVTADAADMANVVAVRYQVMASSIDSTGLDGVLTQSFSQTVTLRNRKI